MRWLVHKHTVQKERTAVSASHVRNTDNKFRELKIFPAVLNGCETWSVTLKEEHSLRVFENRVMGEISASKRESVTGNWRRMQNEKLRDMYSSGYGERKKVYKGGACSTNGEEGFGCET